MTYEFALDYMEEVQKKGSILGLDAILELLKRLHNPQNQLKVIHVAGTNGKGSICSFLEQLYKSEGQCVGRYISPTIHCYLERFQIDGRYMKESEFVTIFETVYPVLEQMQVEGCLLPTAFEIETVIAFLFFLKKNVDIVILETGMGGREDATNVVCHPLCTVFASIGMDHMQFLGNTLEEIAYAKAGIIKKDTPVVTYPNAECVQQVLQDEFEKVNDVDIKNLHKMFCAVKEEEIAIEEETLTGSRFRYLGQTYEISLGGRYQIYNAVTAIQTKLLLDGHVNKEALKDVKWEGRFEIIGTNPLFIRDGAHNIDGVRALKESLEKHFTNRDLIFIIGVLRDKEYEKMMKELCPLASRVFTITPPVERGLQADILADAVRPYCKEVQAMPSLSMAMEQALEYKQSVVVAWGSLSYLGQIK